VNIIRKEFKPHSLLITGKEGKIVNNKGKVLQSSSEYNEQHFDLQDDSGEVWTMCVPTAEPYVEPTNDADTEMAISKLKNGEAAGHDQIPTELIKRRKRAQEGYL